MAALLRGSISGAPTRGRRRACVASRGCPGPRQRNFFRGIFDPDGRLPPQASTFAFCGSGCVLEGLCVPGGVFVCRWGGGGGLFFACSVPFGFLPRRTNQAFLFAVEGRVFLIGEAIGSRRFGEAGRPGGGGGSGWLLLHAEDQGFLCENGGFHMDRRLLCSISIYMQRSRRRKNDIEYFVRAATLPFEACFPRRRNRASACFRFFKAIGCCLLAVHPFS